MSEPGPIDNSSVICRHGGVRPLRVEHKSSVMTAVPGHVFHFLHSRYGGHVAVTDLVLCTKCQEEERLVAEQKEYEMQQFKQYHEDERGQEGDKYCVSAAWFRDWEAWVCNKSKDAPGTYIHLKYLIKHSMLYFSSGPINNKGLVVNRQTGPGLRPNIDHYKFGENTWKMLLSHYGGGPEVVIVSEGGVRVMSPTPAPRRQRSQDLHLED